MSGGDQGRGVRKQRKLQEGTSHEETLTCVYHEAEEAIRRWGAEGSSFCGVVIDNQLQV